jgi:hypothetical protein
MLNRCHWRLRRLALPLAAAGALLHGLPAARSATVTDVGVRVIQRLTGPTETGHVAVGGTDLGHMVRHEGKTYFLFGDTFSGEDPGAGGLWRSNVMAYSTDATPADGIALDGWITDPEGRAKEVIASGRTSPITEIPTGAISANGNIYAWYMAVNWWGPAGEWTNNYAGLSRWSAGQSDFTVVEPFAFPASSNFGMVAASRRDDLADASDERIYLWGTPAGRLGGVKLARVLPQDIENLNAYEYFGGVSAGQPTWISSELSAPLIVAPTVGEMSVMYNPGLKSWTMLYLNHNKYAIELRQADQPWGPWSEPIEVATGQRFPGLYGSYMNPLYVEDDGRTIYFTMSLWNPYDVYLAKATLVTAPESPLSADFNNDFRVDAQDLAMWRSAFGATNHADANGDGVSTGADFLEWQRQLGLTTAPAAAVPEPAAALLLLIAAMSAFTLRRTSSPA